MGARKASEEEEPEEAFDGGDALGEDRQGGPLAAIKPLAKAGQLQAQHGKKRRRKGLDEDAQIDDPSERAVSQRSIPSDMKLEKIVALPTWREMLLDLVATNRLDPWNIDLVEVATGYLDKIRKMEMLDLRVPANLILAAAILLRFKSQALRFDEQEQVVEEQTYVEGDAEASVIPVLELKTRIPPTRMVTLDELLVAMERVFDDQKKREEKAQKVEIPTVINIQLPEFNMEEEMEGVYARIGKEKDTEGLATFSSLLDERTPVAMIGALLPLLHLVQDRRVSIFQEQVFGEIFIRVRETTGTRPPS
jgi:segregation and condensation protein A